MSNPVDTKSFSSFNMPCEHAIPGTGSPGYKGVEVCPHCGKCALMFTEFIPVDKENPKKEEVERDADHPHRGNIIFK